MSVEDNKSIVRRFWEEGWDAKNPDIFDELMDEQYAAEDRAWSTVVWAAYPDARMELVEMIAEGNKVVSHVRFTGTHQGELWGVAPTGKTMTIDGMFIHRVVDGRITWEGRVPMIDMLSWYRQLGLVPGE